MNSYRMELEILGNGNEIGKSAFMLNDGKKKVMLDYGVKIQPEPPQYPMPAKPDAVILSHAHLDHSGGLPILYKKKMPPIYMNKATHELIQLLLEDSIKIAKKEGYNAPFGHKELKKMNRSTRFANYNHRFKIGNTRYSLHDAGHIPGSASILAEGKKRVFYTGDIQTSKSNLLRPAVLPKKVDTLILESTYGDRVRSDRRKMEKKFLRSVEETLANGEISLVPSFAVGRTQEILLILEKHAREIALDGMARKATEIIAEQPRYLKDRKRLKRILRKVHWVHSRKRRVKALKKYPIIVSSAGMLGGGPAVHYLREIKKREGSKVLFTGFLVEDSPGRKLMETKVFQGEGERFHVKCKLEQYELSAHADKNGLMSIIERTKPERVISIHGDNCKKFAHDIRKAFPNVEAIAPKNGDVIRL